MNESAEPTFNLVLIIDDTDADLYITNRTMVKKTFANKVLQFSMGEDALEYLTKNIDNPDGWPQVIIVDIHMPGMTGFEFMEEFNKYPQSLKSQCGAFMTSSSIDSRDVAEAKKNENILGFHEKPITRQFLDTIIQKMAEIPKVEQME